MLLQTGSQVQSSDPWADFWPKLIIAIIGTLIGILIGAVLMYAKNRAEIVKLKSESTKNAADLLEKVNKSANEYNTACQECRTWAMSLIELIKQSAEIDEILNTRELLCASLLESVVPKFVQFCELSILKHDVNDVNADNFVVEYVCGELSRFSNWMKIINSSVFVAELGKSPARVAAYKLDDLNGLLKNIPKSNRAMTASMLQRAIFEFSSTQ